MQCKCGGRGGTAAVLFALPPLSLSCTCVAPVTADACGTSWQRCRAFKKLTAWQTINGCMSACVCVCVCGQLYATIRKCVSIILEKKKKHHTHSYWYFPDFSLSLSFPTREWRASELANEQTKSGSDIWIAFFFSYLFVLYKRSDADVNGNVEGGVA